jgi:hypothetical protein
MAPLKRMHATDPQRRGGLDERARDGFDDVPGPSRDRI